MKNIIKKEILNLNINKKYWGSKENIKNETKIFNCFMNNKRVNQNWFDERHNYTNVELLEELLKLNK